MITGLFCIDQLSMLMFFVIGLVGISVLSFTKRYLKGDRFYSKFLGYMIALICSLMFLNMSDNVFLFAGLWGLSNFFLVQLMAHKKNWPAAQQSSLLAQKYFAFDFCMLSLGLSLLVYSSGSFSIYTIVRASYQPHILHISIIFLLLAALVQSAIWPFYTWLISSLNSPTPVSALMHAGLVNGGGLLLVKFCLLYKSVPQVFTIIFMVGLITAIGGSLFKLVQTDVKRMLACSTVGQMGFMMVQCGLGIFPAAIAHLCFHGFFKAYLFLRSGSVVQEQKIDLQYPVSIDSWFFFILSGIVGIAVFDIVSQQYITVLDTNLVLMFVVGIVSLQIYIAVTSQKIRFAKIKAFGSVIFFSLIYGLVINLVEKILSPLHLMYPQPLAWFHIVAMIIFVLLWVYMIYSNYLERTILEHSFLQRLYVTILNMSQPDTKTVTAYKNTYRYNKE